MIDFRIVMRDTRAVRREAAESIRLFADNGTRTALVRGPESSQDLRLPVPAIPSTHP